MIYTYLMYFGIYIFYFPHCIIIRHQTLPPMPHKYAVLSISYVQFDQAHAIPLRLSRQARQDKIAETLQYLYLLFYHLRS